MKLRVGARAGIGATAFAWIAASCAPRTSAVDPRYFAVHDALAAMGMAQVGPIQRGSLAAGQSVRSGIELPSGCATLVAIGGDGVNEIDASLLASDGSLVAHDTGHGSQATLHACVDRAGGYALDVKMTSGAGEFLAAAWSSKGPTKDGAGDGDDPGSHDDVTARGTCESPLSLAAGEIAGSTAHGGSDNDGSCTSSTSRETVYRLVVASRARATIETIDPTFDTVVYVRQGECGDASSEIEGACNDDFEHDRRSRVRAVLDPGTYFVFVDGLPNDDKDQAYKLRVTLDDVPTIADACRAAEPLTPGVEARGDTSNAFDTASASCGDEAHGGDAVYALPIASRSRVRITERASDLEPVVHVRRACADESTEVACAEDGITGADATYTGVLDPGQYAVFADAIADRNASGGAFTLLAETQPEHGAGVAGDACGDATPIAKSGPVIADTFAARDDVAGSCGGVGAADVVYRVDVTHKTRVVARFAKQESRHVAILTRACGDPSAEVACGGSIDRVVPPGTYWLAIDGAKASDFGRYEADVRLLDVGGQEAACKSAPLLRSGTKVSGVTTGAGDKFTTSCAGSEDAQASDDRVYRVDLARRSHVSLKLATDGWDGVLALRRACTDGPTTSELQCNNDSVDTRHSQIDRVLDRGSYYVVVDGHMVGNAGAFTLEYVAK